MFKCAPQIKGLVRGEPKPGQKHRANGKAIIGEAGKERNSASETLDRAFSYLNQYDGYESGYQCWDEMVKHAEEYRTQGKTKDGKPFERALRSDAVIGYAVIINPPDEVCENWSDAEYQKFYADTWECLHQIEPRVFRMDNLMMQVEHYDEGLPTLDVTKRGRHLHRFGEAKDADGKYCGNVIDAKLLSTINQKYPAMMRQLGWEMEDLDTTDWNKYKTDTDYKAERKAKRKQSGKSVNKYVRSQSQKDRLAAAEMVKKAGKLLADTEQHELEVEVQENQLAYDKENFLDALVEQFTDAKDKLTKKEEKLEEDFQKKEDALEAQKQVEIEAAREMMQEARKAKIQYEGLYKNAAPEVQRVKLQLRHKEREERAKQHFDIAEEHELEKQADYSM